MIRGVDMQLLLEEVVAGNRHWTSKGETADYIPELRKADQNALGITVTTTGGEYYTAGDCNISFTLQSISKVFTLLLALEDHGEKQLFTKVGMEPTGDPYNSLVKLETVIPAKPLNPMINAGAIAVTGQIKGKDQDEKFQRVLDFIRLIAGNSKIDINHNVYESERETGDRNRALAFYLKDIGVLEVDPMEIVDIYFRQCSIEVDCHDLAKLAFFLANRGALLPRSEYMISPHFIRIAKTFMVTCGMYDGSGEFAIKVGIPAKSGVSGGIMAVVPDRMGIGVIGPALNKKGNSSAGINVLEDLSRRLHLSIF